VQGIARVLVGIVVIASSACAAAVTGPAAAPAGLARSEHWTFPLVGPLEDDLLITTVKVRGHGPYLFAIDPDANVTSIDEEVVEDAGLGSGTGPGRVDENGTVQTRAYTDVVELAIGDLKLARRTVMVVPANFYDTRGRHLNGVLGRDVIRSSLVFGFDRDQGIATLATANAFTPPSDAVTIETQPAPVSPVYAAMVTAHRVAKASGREEASTEHVASSVAGSDLDVTPIARQVAAVQVGDAKLAMHIDLGSPVSQLRELFWSKIRISPGDVSLRLVDEAATVRRISNAGIIAEATLGTAKPARMIVIPYVDKRFAVEQLDGALGLDFFSAYAVYANWARGAFYLKPRGDTAAATVARLSRWGADLPACPHPGCISAQINATSTGLQLEIVRDPESANRSLEVFLGVTPAAGKSPTPLAINLPKTVDKISGGLPADYEGATLAVLDASPFARECSGDGGCVFALTPPVRDL
jgi:hypothetical protein